MQARGGPAGTAAAAWRVLSLAVMLAAAPVGAAVAADHADGLAPVTIEEWPVPYDGRPRDPFATDGAVWFCGQTSHYLARLDPATGKFEQRRLEDGAGPHNLIVAADGAVWYAGNRKAYIGRYDPDEDTIHRVSMPDPAAKDPHTLVFDAGQKHIWFTVQHGNFVGRLTLGDEQVDLIPVPTPRARPYGIRMAPDGTAWVALFGTNRLASVDPQSLKLTEHELPDADARPRRLEVTADGRVWYADHARGRLGMYDPAEAAFADWLLPSGDDARPYGTALDGSGRVWVVETGVVPNRFVGFDTGSEEFFSVTPIPSKGATVRHMHYEASSDAVWFGTDTLTVGRADVSPAEGTARR